MKEYERTHGENDNVAIEKGNSGLASGVCMQKSDWFYYLYSRLAKRVVARMRRWSLIRRRAPVAQRLRQSRQQVGQCLSRDEGRAALPHIMCFFTALPQILSLHCRFCLVAACRKCVRGILPFVFRGIFEALPLLFCSLFLATKCS